jgi:flavin-dependent dehydrogenase
LRWEGWCGEDAGMSEFRDVIVMGGGPAGTACGNFLARAGVDVLVLEGEKHPRHHVGESLLAASMPLLERLGVTMAEMAERYQPKFGARFFDPATERMEVFAFDIPDGAPAPSYQAVRETFDRMLAQKALEAGCEVREASMIEVVEEEAERPRVTLRGGNTIACRLLVDATGRQPLLAIKRKTRKVSAEYGRVGIYNYFTQLPPHDGEDANYITMYLFEGGWVWLIPLRNGTTSVGVVYRDVPAVDAGSGKTEAMFWHAVKRMPRLEARLRAARAMEPYRAISDYTYTVSEKIGPDGKFVAIGDAAGFLDPIFSSGVHLALASAEKASAGIVQKLRTGSEAGLTEYAAFMDQGYHVFRAFVERFYNGGLVRNLFFMENKPAAIHAAMTRILAGHVWETGNPVLKMIGVGTNDSRRQFAGIGTTESTERRWK